MTVLVGVHDAAGTDGWAPSLAAAAGIPLVDVVRLGSLTVAARARPEQAGQITCIFNGDLYDTEGSAAEPGRDRPLSPGLVVARGYARHGETFLHRLRGSYQLVLWDAERQEAIIAADHLSARAVFYHSLASRTTFASDIAPLLAVVPTRPAPDPQTVARWITDRTLPHGLTLYNGVRRLQIGWSVRLRGARQRLLRLWEPAYVAPEPLGRDEAGALLRAAVDRAVRRRLGADGTTGILLSGGLDSGILAGTAAPMLRERGHTLPAYSSVFPGQPYDESPWIETLTRELGLPSTRITVAGGALHSAVRFQERWQLPLPAPGVIMDQPLLALARHAGVNVMFDGQGGDELFAASPYLLADLVLGGRWKSAYRLAHRFPGVGPELGRHQARVLLQQLVLKGALPYVAHRVLACGRRSDYTRLDWLTAPSRRAAEQLEDPWEWKRGRSGRPRWWSMLSYMLVGARDLAGTQDFLRRRGEMCGVDSRQPLLVDVDLVELMLRMPPHLAFSPDHDRALARGAMKGVVPERVRLPIRKSNYGELMHRTLEQELPHIRRLLSARDAEIRAFVDLERVGQSLLSGVPRPGEPGWQSWGHRAWSLATTELWLRGEGGQDAFTASVSHLGLAPSRVGIVSSAGQPQGLHSTFFPSCVNDSSTVPFSTTTTTTAGGGES